MPQLIKQGEVITDDWLRLDQLDTNTPIPEGKLLLSVAIWDARRSELLDRAHLGIWLESDEEPSRISADLAHFELVAINFPAFSDGRGYSYARLLRERYHFQGELRAIGDVLLDQLFYMKRCGFDTFSLRSDQDAQAAINSMDTFSESYQAATDQAVPLFRRR